MDSDDPLEKVARLRLATARLARQLRQQSDTGLTPSQQSALVSIDLHGPLTLGRLAKFEQIAPPTVTRIVGKLAEDDLVTRSIDENDRRISHLAITAEGRRRLDHSRRRRNAWLAQRLREFDADQLADVDAALRVMEALAASPETEPEARAEPQV